MIIDTPELTNLERLPTEIIDAVARCLPLWDVKHLSRTSKRLRQACLPTVFRHVKFEFSLAGIERLKSFWVSDVRSHVTSFTYKVTELLKTEILDFSYFRADILTPDDYVDIAKGMYDDGNRADDFPTYMSIYETVRGICEEQRSIVDEGADLLLSSVFSTLPLLKEVRLSFCEALRDDECLLSPEITKDDLYQHHLQVVTSAIQNARRTGVAIHTISLCNLDLPYYYEWESPSRITLSESLRRLLENTTVLRLRGSESVLKLLSHGSLGLLQLDLCGVAVADTTLRNFLKANKKTIQSIGFHRVEISPSSLPLTSCHFMTSSTLCDMLGVPLSTPCRADDCGCLQWWKGGSRLIMGVISDDRLQSFATSPKRKLDDL